MILLGVISFAYQGVTYNTHRKVLDIGPIQTIRIERKTIPLPPILGGIAMVGGIAMLILGGRKEE